MIDLALLAVVTVATALGDGSVHGQVHSDRDEPVAGVRVEIPSRDLVVLSDSTGAYSFEGLDPGEVEIVFSRFAYDPLRVSVRVPDRGALRLDVELVTRFVVQPRISVLAMGAADGPASAAGGFPELGSRVIPAEAIWSSPFASVPDAFAPLAAIPGVDMAEEAPTQFHVRGGSADENLVLLDGAPVYNANHTSGILSALTPDAVDRMLVHTGVFPARYGGRLSSVIDVRTRTPGDDRLRVQGGAGVPDARLAFETPLPGVEGGLLLGGRRTTYDLAGRGETGVESSGFEDVLGKLEVGLLGGTLEVVALHTDNWLSSSVGDPPAASVEGIVDGHNGVGWSSGTDAVSWRRTSAGGDEIVLRAWRAATRASLEWGAGGDRHHLLSRLVHWGVASEAGWSTAASMGRVGVSVEGVRSSYETRILDDPTAEELDLDLEGGPRMLATYVEGRWIPRDRWIVDNGLRVVAIGGDGLALEPRVSGHYRPHDRWTLSVGYGRAHQVVQSLANEESLLNAAYAVEPLVATGADGIPVSRSDQLTAAVETAVTERLRLTIDGYVRWLEDLVLVGPETPEPFATTGFEIGEGRAHGMGAGLAYRTEGVDLEAIAEWGSVSRSVEGETYSPRFERRRAVAVAVGYRPVPSTVLRGAIQVSAGAPTSALAGGGFDWETFDHLSGEVEFSGTPIRVSEALNDARLPTYVRLDLGIRRTWRLESLGPGGDLTTYLDVLNVLGRRNAVGYQIDADGGTRELRLLPVSVAAGVEWRF